MNTLMAILFSYAMILSKMHSDEEPELVIKPKSFFVEQACFGNKNCAVYGWYPKEGNKIYISEDLDLDNKIADSIVIHEIVHYLQNKNGKYVDKSCESMIQLELEAYSVQKQYLYEEGVINNVTFNKHLVECE